MPDRLRIGHENVIDWTVSLTIRVPPPADDYLVGCAVLVEGYGYRAKAVMEDDGHRLVTLVRDRALDVEDEMPPRRT